MRKIVIIIFVVMITLIPVSVQGASYNTYEGTISQTAYFAGIVQKFGNDVDYVCFRNGQYTHVLVYGKLINNGNIIKGDGLVNVVTYNSQTSANAFTYSTDSNFILTVGNTFCYSNLGVYPQITNDSREVNNYVQAGVIGIAVLFLYLVFRDIFSINIR